MGSSADYFGDLLEERREIDAALSRWMKRWRMAFFQQFGPGGDPFLVIRPADECARELLAADDAQVSDMRPGGGETGGTRS